MLGRCLPLGRPRHPSDCLARRGRGFVGGRVAAGSAGRGGRLGSLRVCGGATSSSGGRRSLLAWVDRVLLGRRRAARSPTPGSGTGSRRSARLVSTAPISTKAATATMPGRGTGAPPWACPHRRRRRPGRWRLVGRCRRNDAGGERVLAPQQVGLGVAADAGVEEGGAKDPARPCLWLQESTGADWRATTRSDRAMDVAAAGGPSGVLVEEGGEQG